MRKVVSFTVDAIQLHIIGNMKPGERLPGEKDLAVQLGVSRSSVREALARLAEKGQIVRQWGVGTFVADREPRTGFGMLSIRPGIPGMLATTGGKPEVYRFSYKVDAADAELFPDFPDAATYSVVRVFAIDGVPAVAIRDRLVATFEEDRHLEPGALQAADVLVADIFAKVGITFELLDVRLRATNLDEEGCSIFDLLRTEPVIETDAGGYDQHGRKILVANGIYRTRVVELAFSVS